MKQLFLKKSSILLFAILILILFSRFFLYMIYIHDPTIHIQQDNYANYALAIKNNTLSSNKFNYYDKRLMPGYAILIYTLSFLIPNALYAGIIVSIISSIFVAYFLWKLIPSPLPALLSVFFPPIWVKAGAKVATEPIFVLVSLLSIYANQKKRYFITGILLGILFSIRLIGIILLFILCFIILKKRKKIPIKLILGFFIPVIILFIFNYIFFGINGIFEQFVHNSGYGGIRLGFIQIMRDIYRTLSWKQYQIFFSGLFYIVVNIAALVFLFLRRKQSNLIFFFFLWQLFTLLFILSLSPSQLIDDFGRYTLASLPALLLGISLPFINVSQEDSLKTYSIKEV